MGWCWSFHVALRDLNDESGVRGAGEGHPHHMPLCLRHGQLGLPEPRCLPDRRGSRRFRSPSCRTSLPPAATENTKVCDWDLFSDLSPGPLGPVLTFGSVSTQTLSKALPVWGTKGTIPSSAMGSLRAEASQPVSKDAAEADSHAHSLSPPPL